MRSRLFVLLLLSLVFLCGGLADGSEIDMDGFEEEEEEEEEEEGRSWSIGLETRAQAVQYQYEYGYGLCEAWRFGVETNTLRKWEKVPAECEAFVKAYMKDTHQYLREVEVVANKSIEYADSLNVSKDGKDAWVFDIDETLLSNLPYYSKLHFGARKFDSKSFNAWVNKGRAPALVASKKAYLHLINKGFNVFVLSGRDEVHRNVTVKNLVRAGFHSWKALLLRGKENQGQQAIVYKSKKRADIEKQGFKIRGNSGDQWSDLDGYCTGDRTFKLPNPMYYISK